MGPGFVNPRLTREMATSETSGRVTLAVVLLAAGTSWNAGNIGPVTSTLSDGFSVSLTAIGLLSGTVFFAGILFSAVMMDEAQSLFPQRPLAHR